MRLRLSADHRFKQDQPDSTADKSPTPPSEHDDKADDRLEGLQVKAQGWANTKCGEEEVKAPIQQPATGHRPIHDPLIAAPLPHMAHEKAEPAVGALEKDIIPHSMVEGHSSKWRQRLRSPWASSPYTLVTTLAAFATMFLMAQSFLTRQLDVKGCGMSYMRPKYAKFNDFDTEHTRFASKYSLYLYREGGLDEDTRACGSFPSKEKLY
jgi:hypothetical protein